MSEAGKAIADSIWSSKPMTSTVVTLKDRLEQTTVAANNAKVLMMEYFTNIFLVEVLMTGIFELIDFFFGPNGRLDAFSREKLESGSAVALAFVKAHHPNADVDAIAEGIPLD